VTRPNLDDAESRELEKLLIQHADIFATKTDDCRRNDRVYHRIDTGEARPIRQVPRRLRLVKQIQVGDMLEGMQRCGIIEESESPWSSPVLLVRKKNADLRICEERLFPNCLRLATL
jgi:hypothetical protein